MYSPLLTIGILGSRIQADFVYNVNTYIGQSFQDFELIFSLEKSQCIPISNIIDTLNAHDFKIADRVKIFESAVSEGLLCNALKIIKEARGKYVLFVSIEDALYDTDVLKRIQENFADNLTKIYSFRTLFHCGNDWVVYPVTESRQDTICVCYPRQKLNATDISELPKCHSASEFGQSLLCHMTSKGLSVNYKDENAIVHTCPQKQQKLNDYYMQPDIWQDRLEIFLASPNAPLHVDKLSKSHAEKFFQLLKWGGRVTEHSVKDELYTKYRQTEESLWNISDSTQQYLNILKYIFICLSSQKRKSLSLFLLKRKLYFRLKTKKKKLLFLTHEYSVWPSFKSVYEQALQSRKFDVRLVYVPFFHTFSQINYEEELEIYHKAGYPAISSQKYNLSEDCPDVVLYVKPYDSIPAEYQIREIRKIVDTVVYIPYGMEIGDTDECLRYQCYSNMQYYATYILAYSPIYLRKMQHYTLTQGHNYLTIGHPRIDLHREKLPDMDQYVTFIRGKAGNRKIVIWNTHFTLSEGDNWGSFHQWGQIILDYFKDHNNLFLLWRPHPLFYKALAENRGDTLEETLDWLRQICDPDNILLDNTASYITAFQVSDALISDWSSLVPEYIAYRKPVLITPKRDGSPSILDGTNQALPIVHKQHDIYRFLDMIQTGEISQEYLPDCNQILFFPQKPTVAEELLKILE